MIQNHNFEDVNFEDIDSRFFNRKFSEQVNKKHVKKFKGDDGNFYIIRKSVNDPIFNVYTIEYEKVGAIVIDEKSDYITGYTSNDSIHVEPSYRRKGIGSAMIKFVKDWFGKPYKPTDTVRQEFKQLLKKL